MSKNKSSSSTKNESTSSNNLVPVITTIIGVVGTIVVAYFASVAPRKMEISATQTAEIFRATQTAEANYVTSIPVVSTNTAESAASALILIPTPTSWLLGNKTATDSKPLCSITVNDFQEARREDAKRVQFTIAGQGGYCSWIVPLNSYNATSKTSVTFWIKGEKGGEQYEIGLKDIKTLPGHEPKVSMTASTTWTQVSISLGSFKSQNLASLENFSLNFKDGSGTIFVSQLIFIP